MPGQSLSWDAEGRPADLTSAGQAQHNIYDADGTLLVQSDPTGTVVFLGDTELRVTPGTSTVSATRTYSALTGPIAVRTASTAVSGSTLNWQDADAQGTALVTVNPTTNQITVRHLTPFGTSRDPGTVTWRDQKGFLNKPVDAFAGLSQLGAREYDPTLGRFLSIDPVAAPLDPQQNNGYSYAHNNPVTLSDPTGLRPAGDKDDTDAGDWGNITTCPSCSNPAPRPNPSDGWTTYHPPAPPSPVVHHHKCGWSCQLGSSLKTVAKITADVTGVTDIIDCVSHPGLASCAMAVAVVASYAIPGAGVALRVVREGIEVERLARAGMAADRIAAETSEKVNLYRGVASDHPGYNDALNGAARPRGGSATAIEHNRGDTRSEFTSWTTDPEVAKGMSYPGGVVMRIPQSSVAGRLVQSPDLFDESEVLIRGPVHGAEVLP